ncbi:hypothetical protein ACFL1B_06085 [Nanoarchaeota archaeon]
MGLIYGKKGDGSDDLYHLLLELVLVTLFAAMWFAVFSSALSNSIFFKQYYSKDLALNLDALHAAQGNFMYSYPVQQLETPLEIYINDGVVALYDYSDTPRENRFATFQNYARDMNIKVQTAEMIPSQILFNKNKTSIWINSTEVPHE